MDFLVQQEVKGIAQDAKQGTVKQDTDKILFEKKLLEGLGSEMEEEIKNPTSKATARRQNLARKLNRKKRRAIWRENLRKIFSRP